MLRHGLTAGLLCLVLVGCTGTVEVTPPEPAKPVKDACLRLQQQLPDRVAGEDRREAEPRSKLTAAWGDPEITLRCGVGKPRAYTKTSQLFTVNGVAWLPVPPGAEIPTAFYAVERTAYIELTVPEEQQPAADALVDLGKAIKATVPKDPDAGP
ncbi:MAG: DUF3515 family protein [Streptosporangiales bacterium]|nr:DUF3515 family protein [Streptosporangiales bacterium]